MPAGRLRRSGNSVRTGLSPLLPLTSIWQRTMGEGSGPGRSGGSSMAQDGSRRQNTTAHRGSSSRGGVSQVPHRRAQAGLSDGAVERWTDEEGTVEGRDRGRERWKGA